ncbi:hypothetical protein NE237_023231 [Protea cynaroides]|uniref:Uncharacterized protein n=1 Tax=Protea cynaroides TaxID=273540 RepID=A0A9Q0HBC4_9MAGN|nr:hypothetical protein NE237_023231 [Protea cynaroides]
MRWLSLSVDVIRRVMSLNLYCHVILFVLSSILWFPGSATIIVRVIACFQQLQDCQAEYFRHLLKPATNNIFASILLVIVLIELERTVVLGFISSILLCNHPS